MPNQLNSIQHVVLLMLENRSFDQMLGFLYETNGNVSPRTKQPFEGLTGTESNPDDTGREFTVYKIDTNADTYLMPGGDPGEGFQNTNYQLFSTDDPAPGTLATNKGFVVNFKAAVASDLAKHYADTLPGTVPSQIMGMYAPESLPILTGLAKGFAVCDQWFASVPTMTLPNRGFANAATSQGHLDDSVKSFTCPSIFGLLTQHKIGWAIYGYNRDPLTRLSFTDTQLAPETHFGHFRDFQESAAAGTLPAYTFLEPSWGSDGNSQHPNYDVALGEQLIHDTYYALRNGPGWNQTLLIITYDEHGGNYDHVAPPWNAIPPDATVGESGFDFTRFGVRVPAVFVSPLIVEGTIFRAASGTIDHTSVLKTLQVRWGLPSLTNRDKAAPDLGNVLTLTSARTDDPIAGIAIPTTNAVHPNAAQPSHLDLIQASQVASLPLRNEKGVYNAHTPPDLSSSGSVADYIQTRMAAWTQHLQRLRQRRTLQAAKPPAPVKKTSSSKPAARKKSSTKRRGR